MWSNLKRVIPGVALIVAAAALLLVIDAGGAAAPRALPGISILQFSSRPVLDDSVRGAVAGLKEAGLEQGRDVDLHFFNTENDIPTANNMAKMVVEGGDRLAVTFSTPLLQIMANANREGKKVHVFGAVTDPFAAGVGITKEGHPAHLAGIGTFQPVREVLQLAKRMNPGLATIGTVWNPGDAAAEACVKLARDECARLGIKLVEAQVDTSSGVAETAAAVAARGVQAFWIGGDNTVELAIDSVVKAARQARIPVFCNAPSHLAAGAYVAMGADYYEVGRLVGKMAAEIFGGKDPSAVKVENVVPRQLGINLGALPGLEGRWAPSTAVLAEASIVVGGAETKSTTPAATGAPASSTAPASSVAPGASTAPTALASSVAPATSVAPAARKGKAVPKPWKIQLLDYVDGLTTEETHAGVFAELDARGLAKGKDYVLVNKSAHGDMSLLNGIFDAALSERPDILLTVSTPTLQAAIRKVKDIPVVYTTVADGVLAGAGESARSHLPNITGVDTMSDFKGMLALVRECLPSARRIGTLFVPAEVNSVRYRDILSDLAGKAGMSLDAVGVSSVTDARDAAAALASRHPDAIVQISDSIGASAFPAIAEAALRERIPLFGFVFGAIKQGAAAVCARDYADCGKLGVDLAIRILEGEDPATIPLTGMTTSILMVSPKNAAESGLKIPDSVLRKADKVVE